MRRMFARGMTGLAVVAVLCAISSGEPAKQRAIPLIERIIAADCIVMGKVVDAEKEAPRASVRPGSSTKAEYKLVSIKIDDAIIGAKGATQLRVGFVAPSKVAAGNSQTAVTVLDFSPQLEVGQEGCFFLSRHRELDAFVTAESCPPLDKKNKETEQQVAFVRKAVKLLADPAAGLRSNDAEDRLMTAGLLAERYLRPRLVKGGRSKQSPVAEEESKLLLNALYDSDWDKPHGDFSPSAIFQRLSLGPNDGLRLLGASNTAKRDWLKEHKDTFRLTKRVEAAQD
jgi:hypothetical protein